jgi:hypothetical protein
MLFSPAVYLTLPYYLATKQPAGQMGWPNSQLPITRTAQGVQTAFNGTGLQWLGDAAGLLAKPEAWARQKLGLGEFGQWGNYYIDRQLSNLAIEGKYPTNDVQRAMIERSGPIYDEAVGRVRQELMYRMPGMAPLAGIAKGATLDALVGSILPSLFPGGLLSPAELEAAGLKNEYNLAWKSYTAGNKKALNTFFDAHPEYQTRLALRDTAPEDRVHRMDNFLKTEIWDAYNNLGKTNRKQVTAYLGKDFESFLSSDPGVAFSTDQLATWARLMNQIVPQVPETQAATTKITKPAPIFSPDITNITDKFFADRTAKFPSYYAWEQGYYSLPKSERPVFLRQHPELKQYWTWKDSWVKGHPEMKTIINGQAFARVDTTNWPPTLSNIVTNSALTGDRLPAGARAMMERLWIQQGKPYGSLNSWLTGVVYPGLTNQMMQGVVP